MTPVTIYRTPAGKEAILAAYDAVLARWPVPHETVHIPTRHGDTFAIISGNDTAAEELRRLTMPILVLIGAEDALRDGEKIIARMREVVPHLTAAILPDQGHALVHTQDRILTFLRDTASSEAGCQLSPI